MVGVLARELNRSDLARFVKSEIQAVQLADRPQIDDPAVSTDSLFFDDVEQNSPCFDYLIGVRCGGSKEVVAVEYHTAHHHHIDTIKNKKRETNQRLNRARAGGCRVGRWVWVASNETIDIALRPGTTLRRLVSEAKVQGPFGRLKLCPAT